MIKELEKVFIIMLTEINILENGLKTDSMDLVYIFFKTEKDMKEHYLMEVKLDQELIIM